MKVLHLTRTESQELSQSLERATIAVFKSVCEAKLQQSNAGRGLLTDRHFGQESELAYF